ncbi:hypothetical protein MNEG_0572 [Monoraphidium neglectum]|uniref:Uncharacterized protein n=1 Tax=Monoraphidium neglectum TaxID=145388 RepID=A0A0D2MY27_9CHLO|nr:hypothetical protein MNEG_0572 [Monoraphidium neglectum]KIZ07385.1 hypothetical protein MNEG_0572 [Monoraphidium neglectum]|eukprot:XP_013906404.1 hypothetical protein MNEG_0572 [Monoraphidium neglectum]
MADLSNHNWVDFNSSDSAIFDVVRGYPSDPGYATYPLLDNRLVPSAPGSANLTLTFGNASTVVAVNVQDTYQPTWPRAGNATDTTLEITANMTGDYTIVFRAVPSAGLDLAGAPPSAADIEGSGAVTLVADAARGPHFYAANATGLTPGTNYTVLLAVRSGLALATGVTALSGALVPDTQPPSFTAAWLVSGGGGANASTGSFSVALDLGLDEPGAVSFAIYGDPACITACNASPNPMLLNTATS